MEKLRERFGNLQMGPTKPEYEDHYENEDDFYYGSENNLSFINHDECYNQMFTFTLQPKDSCFLVEKPVLKMTNIPWEVSSLDVKDFFHEYDIDILGIHIPIDRTNGKTRNEIYVEFNEFRELVDALARSHRQLLKSREIFVCRSSWIELTKAHFPRATKERLLTLEEQHSLISICRYYKVKHAFLPFLERPFEHVCSLLRLAAWSDISKEARHQLHGIFIASMEALMGHISKMKDTCPCQKAVLVHQTSASHLLNISLAVRALNAAKQWGHWDSTQLEEVQQIEKKIDALSSQNFSKHSCCFTVKQLKEQLLSLEKALSSSSSSSLHKNVQVPVG